MTEYHKFIAHRIPKLVCNDFVIACVELTHHKVQCTVKVN